ncbi:MAG: hypothetical protein R3D57_03605 [Hyphomicrobiaceae bacterium]
MRRFLCTTGFALVLLAATADRVAACPGLGTSGPSGPVVTVTPDGRPGYLPDCASPLPSKRYAQASFDDLAPGTTVQLLPSTPGLKDVAYFEGQILLKDLERVTIRGLGRRTIVRGLSLDGVRDCTPPPLTSRGCKGGVTASAEVSHYASHNLFEALLDAGPNGTSDAIEGYGKPPKSDKLDHATCIDIKQSHDITIEDVDFDSCWLAAIRVKTSHAITLRRAFITRGSYGMVVRGRKRGQPAERRSSDITVEDSTWVQDTTGYEGNDARFGACKADHRWKSGCPGDMWRTIPWGSVHHGSYDHFNGALLTTSHVAGPIVFRRNAIFNAYNGVRLTVRQCSNAIKDGEGDAVCEDYSHGIWIYGNRFSYIRDNPVELEDWAVDAFVYDNEFHNSHAWLSLDGAGGGPIYAFANRGWFDDMPAVKWSRKLMASECTRLTDYGDFYDSRFDRRFDYSEGGWYEVGIEEYTDDPQKPVRMNPAEMACRRGMTGRVIKLGMPDADASPEAFDRYPYLTKGPLYVFNNSWYIRGPVTGIGMAKNIRHWNNAILFCEPGVEGYDPELCKPPPDPARGDPQCGAESGWGLAQMPAEAGAIPFFTCFRWYPIDGKGQEMRDGPNAFDYDISNNGFPPSLRASYGMNVHGRHADPGFKAPSRGDLRLKPGAAAATSPCVVTADGQGALGCATDASGGFVGAYAPDGTLFGGPAGLRIVP